MPLSIVARAYRFVRGDGSLTLAVAILAVFMFALYIALFVPHAFAIGGIPVEASARQYKFNYFSFITLTSTGYGDITPIHPYARSLASFEAIAGQLYLAVLIARLVGLEMDWREAQRDTGIGR